MKYPGTVAFIIFLSWIIMPVSAEGAASCIDYPLEMLALLAAIPIICISVAIVILWHYATKSAESLFDKILNIGVALVVDAAIIGVGIKLFFALVCHATF